jgi:hypothetical protein
LDGGEPVEIARQTEQIISFEPSNPNSRLEKRYVRGFFNGWFRLFEEVGALSKRSAALALSVSAAAAEKRRMRIRLSGLLL